LKQQAPDIAELFENSQKIDEMKIPQVDESAPILYHWEKVARRMLSTLMKHQKAWIFNEPVQPEKQGLPDYFDVIQNPMDFGTIEKKLKHHEYLSMQHFLQDVELVFENCFHYNGEQSAVGMMGREVQEEYNKQCQQLQVDFYITTETDA
jgi:hypothetical protein